MKRKKKKQWNNNENKERKKRKRERKKEKEKGKKDFFFINGRYLIFVLQKSYIPSCLIVRFISIIYML